MKLFCLLLTCFTFGALPRKAPTLHALLVADSNDATIGAGAQENNKNLQKWFLQAASQLHMTPQIVVIEGAQFSCEIIDSSVGKLKAAADDVVVFYYSGHGFRTSIEQSRFPDFYCGSQVFSAVTDALHT